MTLDLRRDFNCDSVPAVRHWQVHELHPALHRLMQHIDQEREKFSGGPPHRRFSRKELAAIGGIHPKTYQRYVDGTHLPTNEEYVEKVLDMAEGVGMSRAEAEAFLPPALEPVIAPVRNSRRDVFEEMLAALKRNNLLLEEIVAALAER